MEHGPVPDLDQIPATAIVGSRELPAAVDPTGPRVFPTDAGPSRLNEKAGFLRDRHCRQLLRHGRDHRAADPMGEMTSAEIGSTRGPRGVVPAVESRKVITISTRTCLATGAIVGENLGITTILSLTKIGVGDSDGITAVNRLGEEAGVLVTETEIQPEDEDVHTEFFSSSTSSFHFSLRPFVPSSLPLYHICPPPFFYSSFPIDSTKDAVGLS
jgi:hypothetical protein